MNDKVSLTLKVSEITKAMIAECARLDYRTVSAYVEAMVEADAKRRMLTMEEVSQRKKRKTKDESTTIPLIDLPDYLDREVWADWVAYRSKPDKPMAESVLKYSLRKMKKAHANGWDVNELIREAIVRGWQGFVFDKHTNTKCSEQENNDLPDDMNDCDERLYNELLKIDVHKSVTPLIYHNFVKMMRETHQLVDPGVISWLLFQFTTIGKGREWNDSILQRAIDTQYIFNYAGKFDVLLASERV